MREKERNLDFLQVPTRFPNKWFAEDITEWCHPDQTSIVEEVVDSGRYAQEGECDPQSVISHSYYLGGQQAE